MIVDCRTYMLRPGAVMPHLNLYQREGLLVQTRHLGQPVGYYYTETGPLNQIVHLWRYESVEDRARRRAALLADRQWQAYLERVTSLNYVETQENKILIPAPFLSI
jgi:hypothetical protein